MKWEPPGLQGKRKRGAEKPRADSRGMSITTFGDNLTAVAFSNGICRIFSIHDTVATVLCDFIISHGHCPWKVVSDSQFLYSIDTGGNLSIFDLNHLVTSTSPPPTPICTKRLDEGGLNAICIRSGCTDDSVDIFVGGDAGVVYYLTFTIFKSILNIVNSVACSTCGLTNLLLTSSNELAALSIDQRILLFSADKKLKYNRGLLSFVADASDFILLNDEFVVVGHGMENISIHD